MGKFVALRCRLAAGVLLFSAGMSGVWAGVPQFAESKRCASAVEWTDEAVADSLGVSADLLAQVKTLRGLSNRDVCTMPASKLTRAFVKAGQPKPDHPGEWASFRAQQQTDETGKVKPDGLINALAQRQVALANPLRDADGKIQTSLAGISQGGWQWIGPGNIGGRIRAILPLSATKILIGSVSGGLWVSSDSGASWLPVNDFMGNLSISSLVADPANGNIIYAGTGEGFYNADAVRGAGIFKSTDGGGTWTQLAATNPSSASDWYYVNRVAVHPTIASTLLAATNGGVYRSTDSGASWSKVSSLRALQVAFDPMDGNRAVYGGASGNVGYSSDAGATWTAATVVAGGKRVEFAFARNGVAPATPGTLIASVDSDCLAGACGGIYRSTNGGGTWSLLSTPRHLSSQGWYDNTLWIDPTNPNQVVIGGLDLHRSTNGGSSWTQISVWYTQPTTPHADHHAIVAASGYNGSSNRTVYFGNDGGIYKASDISAASSSGSSWQVLNNGLGITQFYGGAGHGSTNGRIQGGTQDNGSLRWSGSGTTWNTFFGGDGGMAAIDPADGNYIYGEYVYAALHRSTNGGVSQSSYICNGIADGYSQAAPNGCGGNNDANFIAPFVLDPNNSSTMYVGGARLWRSTNVKAATPAWSAVKGYTAAPQDYYARISRIAVAPGNSNIVWVGNNGGAVYKSSDANLTSPSWAAKGSGTLPNRMVLGILVDKTSAETVYVSFGGYSTGNLWRTTDGGATWTSIHNNLPATPIRSIERHPDNANWLYAGTEVGIYSSEDGGATWNTTNDGPANVSVDQLFWYNSSTLVAVTHGRGMFTASVSAAGSSSLQFGASSASVNEGSSASLSVTRTGSATAAASINYTTAAGTATSGVDFTASSGTLSWGAGDTSSRTITVPTISDTLFEGNETFSVTLSGATGATLGAASTATVTIVDDDAPPSFPPNGSMPAGWVKPSDAATGWTVASDFAYEGSYSLKSVNPGNAAAGQRVTSGVQVSGRYRAGNAAFALRADSESGYDFLRFYIDGVLQHEWSGQISSWTVVSFPVTAGRHTFKWEYSKDEDVGTGADAVWIDAVQLPAKSASSGSGSLMLLLE